MTFEQDHFSRKAAVYAKARPAYPAALYDRLAALAPGRALVWDCGTGSGQAALALAGRFERVIATDASAAQIEHHFAHPRVHYAIARAERAPLRDGTVDLVTVAAAVHWFDLDLFYAEALRVLRPGGVLSVWTYLEMHVDPAFDRIMDAYAFDTLKEDWPERMKYPLAHYANLPFPLEPVPLPAFRTELRWSLYDVRAFMETWSGTQRHHARTGRDPIEPLWPRLVEAWGDPAALREVHWPLHLKAGQKAQQDAAG